MRRFTMVAVLVTLTASATSLPAQDVPLPEYTDQQRWERLATLMIGWQSAVIALGESHGMTAEEVGDWLGEFFTQGWLGGAEASQLLTSLYRNHMSMPGATAEVLSSGPTTVTARFNRPADDLIAPTGRNGVPAEKFAVMFDRANQVIADWVGVGMTRERDGDWDVLTLETQYGDIVAHDQIRWNRSSFFNWLSALQMMSMRKEAGMTPREMGEADAELYASTWTARTPWSLFRGMTWNRMSDAGSTPCEVLHASPDEVRARCAMDYRDMVTANEGRFGISVEDMFESNRAFAEGVAEYLGMRWTETIEDGQRMITVTMR